MASLQGHPQSGSDVGWPPEEDPQQYPVHEGPDEPNHFSGGVIPAHTGSVYCRIPSSRQSCILLEPLRRAVDLHTDCDFSPTSASPPSFQTLFPSVCSTAQVFGGFLVAAVCPGNSHEPSLQTVQSMSL